MNTNTTPEPMPSSDSDRSTTDSPAVLDTHGARRRGLPAWGIIGIAASAVVLVAGGAAVGVLAANHDDDDDRVVRVETSAGSQARGDVGDSNHRGDLPNLTSRVDVDDDVTLSDADLATVVSAALAAAGGDGVVTDVDADRDDPRGYVYEVEVRRTDGTEVDVMLDINLVVVATEEDSVHGR